MPRRKIREFLEWFGSKSCFIVMLVMFGISAIWIAVSSVYPMAFDEDYHLGLIKIYAHHLSPFFASQPAGTYQYGAFARDPSYLYHYLMSFPWRLVSLLTHNFTTQVITMRLINVLLFGVGIVLFRLLLLKSKISPRLIHLALLLFILTPLTPLVAAQINYDNLLLPLLALSLILTVNFARQLKDHHFSWQHASLLFALCLLTSLVKYAFLPIFVAIGVYCLWQSIKWFKQDRHDLFIKLRTSFKQLSRLTKFGLIGLVLLSGGLFFERYGLNTLRYHSPIPECDQVLTVKQCQAYGPWKRNYDIQLSKQPKPNLNPLHFSYIWLNQMAYNLSFALNGSASGYSVGRPLPLPNLMVVGFFSVGLLVAIICSKHLLKDEIMRLGLLLILAYLAALWLQNFTDYDHLGLPVAIQGRYLLPILILGYVAIVVSFSRLFRDRQALKLASASMAVGCLFLGGGAMTFILRSDPTWYWPNSKVVTMNKGARGILKPFIPGSRS